MSDEILNSESLSNAVYANNLQLIDPNVLSAPNEIHNRGKLAVIKKNSTKDKLTFSLLLANFSISKAQLKTNHKNALKQLILISKSLKRDFSIVKIIGRASRTGPENAQDRQYSAKEKKEEHNITYSKVRANSVKKYLIENGVYGGVGNIEWKGSSDPVKKSLPIESDWNRSVEIQISISLLPPTKKVIPKPKPVPKVKPNPQQLCPKGLSQTWVFDFKTTFSIFFIMGVNLLIGEVYPENNKKLKKKVYIITGGVGIGVPLKKLKIFTHWKKLMKIKKIFKLIEKGNIRSAVREMIKESGSKSLGVSSAIKSYGGKVTLKDGGGVYCYKADNLSGFVTIATGNLSALGVGVDGMLITLTHLPGKKVMGVAGGGAQPFNFPNQLKKLLELGFSWTVGYMYVE